MPPTQYPTGTRPLNVARADVDLDGDSDIIVCEVSDRTVSVMRNNGRGQFTRSALYMVRGAPVWVVAGNLNADDYPDLVVADEMFDTVSVRLNDKTGEFGSATGYTVGKPTTLALEDMGGDGKLDLLVTDQDHNNVSVFTGDGAGGFGSRRDYRAGNTPRSLAVADLNGDGRSDVATVNYYGGSVSVFTNTGGGLSLAGTYNVGLSPFCVAVGDVNADSAADLVVSNLLSNNAYVLFNNGSAQFTYSTPIAVGTRPRHVSLDDVTGDGRADLTVTNYDANTVSILSGNGAGGFSASGTYAIGAGPWSAISGDIDGDLKPDLVTANRDGNSISVLRSNSSALSTSLSLTQSATKLTYGRSITLTARLTDAGGESVGGREIVLERKTPRGWSEAAKLATSVTGLVTKSLVPVENTTYRVRYPGGSEFRASTSADRAVKVSAYVGTPSAPSRVSRGRSFSISGFLKPRHRAGSRTVRLYCYRYQSGRWVLRRTVTATNRNYSSYTKYVKSTALPLTGRWRIRAYHADTGHYARYSSYRYVTVR